jgi:hypothetical protein
MNILIVFKKIKIITIVDPGDRSRLQIHVFLFVGPKASTLYLGEEMVWIHSTALEISIT